MKMPHQEEKKISDDFMDWISSGSDSSYKDWLASKYGTWDTPPVNPNLGISRLVSTPQTREFTAAKDIHRDEAVLSKNAAGVHQGQPLETPPGLKPPAGAEMGQATPEQLRSQGPPELQQPGTDNLLAERNQMIVSGGPSLKDILLAQSIGPTANEIGAAIADVIFAKKSKRLTLPQASARADRNRQQLQNMLLRLGATGTPQESPEAEYKKKYLDFMKKREGRIASGQKEKGALEEQKFGLQEKKFAAERERMELDEKKHQLAIDKAVSETKNKNFGNAMEMLKEERARITTEFNIASRGLDDQIRADQDAAGAIKKLERLRLVYKNRINNLNRVQSETKALLDNARQYKITQSRGREPVSVEDAIASAPEEMRDALKVIWAEHVQANQEFTVEDVVDLVKTFSGGK